MEAVTVNLLGPCRVVVGTQPVIGFSSNKGRALLAYLAVEHDRPHRREMLAGLLWPDVPEANARQSLSQAFFSLRKVLGREVAGLLLTTTRETIRCDIGTACRVDAASLTEWWAACREHAHDALETCPTCAERLEQIVGLYAGDLLSGFSLPDSPAFEEWLLMCREEYRRVIVEALRTLVIFHAIHGNRGRALGHARQWVDLLPVDEEAHRQLMRLLAQDGQRSAALAQYETCRRLLREELDVEPEPATTVLYEHIRSGQVEPSSARTVQLAGQLPDFLSEPERYVAPLFVARERELTQLERWLGEALDGQGRVGFVVGEAGSGKTLLLREFARRTMEAHPELVVASGGCNAYSGMGDSYLPFLEILRLLTGDFEAQWAAGTLSRVHAQRLQAVVPAALQAVLQEGPALLDTLLPSAALVQRARNLLHGDAWEARLHEALSHKPGIGSQSLLFDQTTRVLQTVAHSQPLLLILDDLQWSDPISVSLLFHLGRRLTGQRLLVLGAYRPEEVAAGRESQPHPLTPLVHEFGALWAENEVDLAQAEGRAFVEALVDSEPNGLSQTFREALYRRTGGHALFTVELLQGLKQRGDLWRGEVGRWIEGPTLDWERLPRRVEAVIAAHIARLSREERELLTVASVEGEEFHAEVAAHVLGRDEQQVLGVLSGSLSREHCLLAAHSLRHAGEQQFSRYRFRHYLFQHYLYQRLDAVQRANLHRRVAHALEQLGAAGIDTPGLMEIAGSLFENFSVGLGVLTDIVSEAAMAWHYEEAGLADLAVRYHLGAAGRTAQVSFAYEQMLSHTRKALALLPSLPDSPARIRLEFLTYRILGWVLSHFGEGRTDPEVGQAWRKSLELAERIGDQLLIADALSWLCWHHRARGALDTALAMNARAASLVRGISPGWALVADAMLAETLIYTGDWARAIQLMEPLIEPLLRTGSNLPWSAKCYGELAQAPEALWCLGYPDRALRVALSSLEMVSREESSFQVGANFWMLHTVYSVHHSRGEIEGMEQSVNKLQAMVESHRCPPFCISLVAMAQSCVRAQRGLPEQAIAELRQWLGPGQCRVNAMFCLAELLERFGRTGEGLALVEKLLEGSRRTGERCFEAELYRLKGELLLQQSPPDESAAETCFQQAIEIAQGQQAKSWELRAATSLARLWQGQGRRAGAREVLAPVYGCFTEGFDTRDLREAAALLEALNRETPSRTSDALA